MFNSLLVELFGLGIEVVWVVDLVAKHLSYQVFLIRTSLNRTFEFISFSFGKQSVVILVGGLHT